LGDVTEKSHRFLTFLLWFPIATTACLLFFFLFRPHSDTFFAPSKLMTKLYLFLPFFPITYHDRNNGFTHSLGHPAHMVLSLFLLLLLLLPLLSLLLLGGLWLGDFQQTHICPYYYCCILGLGLDICCRRTSRSRRFR